MVLLHVAMSLDGFIAGPGHDMSWTGGAEHDTSSVRFAYKIDPRRNSVVNRVRLPEGTMVIDLDGDKSTLWSAGWWGVAKISDSGRVLFHESVPGSGWSMALTPRAVWVAQPFEGNRFQRRQDKPARRVLKMSMVPGVPRVTVIDLESQPGGIAALADTVWVAANGGLVRIDATAIKPAVVPIPVDVAPGYLEPFPGGVWVAERSANRIKKVC